MFIEAIVALAILIFAGSLVLGLIKFVFTMILLPVKLVFVLSKGLLGLVIGLPLLLIGGLLLGAGLPLLLLVILAPVWIIGGLVCAFLA